LRDQFFGTNCGDPDTRWAETIVSFEATAPAVSSSLSEHVYHFPDLGQDPPQFPFPSACTSTLNVGGFISIGNPFDPFLAGFSSALAFSSAALEQAATFAVASLPIFFEFTVTTDVAAGPQVANVYIDGVLQVPLVSGAVPEAASILIWGGLALIGGCVAAIRRRPGR
jgi:hypothetical protein